MQNSRDEQNNANLEPGRDRSIGTKHNITKGNRIRNHRKQNRRGDVLQQKSHQNQIALRRAWTGSPEEPNLCAPKKQTRERTPRGWEETEACAPVQFSLALARAGHVLWSEQWRRGRRRKNAGNGRCQVLMACLSASRPVNSLGLFRPGLVAKFFGKMQL
jgi:hypothetical protein